MKPFIIVCDGLDTTLFQAFKDNQSFEVHPQSKIKRDELMELIPRAHGLIIRSATVVDNELLDRAQELKYVIRAGEGTDNIDKDACKKKGVKVSNTPGANNNSAAEHAIALMFTLLRKTAWAHSDMKNKEWNKSLYTGNEMTGKTIGIVGLGRIGSILARRLSGFDIKVLYFDPHIKETEIAYAKQVDSLQTLFRESDIISVHVPLLEATKNLVSGELLDLMSPHALLINASRGGVVNEEDLYTRLKEKTIRGAGLDVFATEPLSDDSPLLKLDNIVLTPHLGASTMEAQYRVGEMAIHQLKEYFLNDNLLNEVRI